MKYALALVAVGALVASTLAQDNASSGPTQPLPNVTLPKNLTPFKKGDFVTIYPPAGVLIPLGGGGGLNRYEVLQIKQSWIQVRAEDSVRQNRGTWINADLFFVTMNAAPPKGKTSEG